MSQVPPDVTKFIWVNDLAYLAT